MGTFRTITLKLATLHSHTIDFYKLQKIVYYQKPDVNNLLS